MGNSDRDYSAVTAFFENSPEIINTGYSSEELDKHVGHARTDNYENDDSDF